MKEMETIRFLKNEFLSIDKDTRNALRRQVIDFLEMVTEDKKKWKLIIKNFLLYIDEANNRMDKPIPYKISELLPTTAVLSVFYVKLAKWLFVEAWTFAISVFNYAEEIQKIPKKQKVRYIW